MGKKKVPEQHLTTGGTVNNTTMLSAEEKYCCISFRYFKPNCISAKDFNNYFRDNEHYQKVISSFLGIVLPKISELKTHELMAGGRFAQQFHFHKVDTDKYDKLRAILAAYSFNDTLVNQLLYGEKIYQFAGNLEGHSVESRIICDYIDDILYILFFDTNHHLYFNKSKVGESLSYDCCPYKSGNVCYNSYSCFAKEFLDIDKINASYGYSYTY